MQGFRSGTGPADVRLIFFSDSKYLEMKVECFAEWGGQAGRLQAELSPLSSRRRDVSSRGEAPGKAPARTSHGEILCDSHLALGQGTVFYQGGLGGMLPHWGRPSCSCSPAVVFWEGDGFGGADASAAWLLGLEGLGWSDPAPG